MDELTKSQSASDLPVFFVAGNSRSGTTMTGRMLGKHSSVFTFGELHFFERLWSPAEANKTLNNHQAEFLLATLMSIQRDGLFTKRHPEFFRDEANHLLKEFPVKKASDVFALFISRESNLHQKQTGCDQTPRNIFYASEILNLYPAAKFICLVRDPRDVVLSQKQKWRRRFLGAKNIPLSESIRAWINYHPITISKLWNASQRAIEKTAGHPRVFVLRFEDLIADAEEMMKKICGFLEINYEAGMLQVPQVGSSLGKDNPHETGIRKDRAGSWKSGGLSEAEIYLIEKNCADGIRKFHYEAEKQRANFFAVFWLRITFPVKLFLALLWNFRRVKNLRETIKRRLQK